MFKNIVPLHEISRCGKITKTSYVACSLVDFFPNVLILGTVSGFVEGYNFLFFSVLFIQMWIILIVVIIVIIAAIVSKCTCKYIS